MDEYLSLMLGEAVPTSGEPRLVVVVHEAGAVAAPSTVEALLAVLGERDDVVAVSVRPVTDTLKVVAADDVVVGTADREHHRFVGVPIALRLSLLRSVPPSATPGALLAALAERARLVPVEG